jgi:hypothetical protein
MPYSDIIYIAIADLNPNLFNLKEISKIPPGATHLNQIKDSLNIKISNKAPFLVIKNGIYIYYKNLAYIAKLYKLVKSYPKL